MSIQRQLFQAWYRQYVGRAMNARLGAVMAEAIDIMSIDEIHATMDEAIQATGILRARAYQRSLRRASLARERV